MTTLARGQHVKSYRNCCNVIFRVLHAHRNGTVTIVAVQGLYGPLVNGIKHKVRSRLLYPAFDKNGEAPEHFIPLHLPLPCGRY